MARKKKSKKENSGGVNIKGKSVSIGGDVIGGDKNVIDSGLTASDLKWITEKFLEIKSAIDDRAIDQTVNKSELNNVVEQIEQEVRKGDSAHPAKVEGWLRYLGAMADDIFEVTVAALINPVAGIGKAIKLIAQKVREDKAQEEKQ
jgi:hypothetical protein